MKSLLILLAVLVLVSCAPKSTDKSQQEWRYLYDLGMSAYYAKNYSEAIARLYEASKIAPGEPKIWNALGIAYMEVEEYEKARISFLKALEADPHFSEAKMNLGILHLKIKDYRKATTYLLDAVRDEAFEKKHIAFYYLAKTYKELGDWERYIDYLKKATAYNPLFLEAQLELGNAYLESKRYREAEKLYRTLLSNNFKFPEIYLNLARIYYRTGRFAEAKEAIRAVLENKQASNLHRSQAYDLLSKVLVEEQKRLISTRPPTKLSKDIATTEESFQEQEGKYAIQIAAFSTSERAQALARKLAGKGLKNIQIIEASGIYKVLYGRFPNRDIAKRELERLKDMEIYGFIVEVE